jgi:hypothetical protein
MFDVSSVAGGTPFAVGYRGGGGIANILEDMLGINLERYESSKAVAWGH